MDASGNIFFLDTQKVRRIDATTGLISTVAGSGVGGFSEMVDSRPPPILTSHAGSAWISLSNLFIADSKNNRIRKVNMTTGIISTVAGSGGTPFCGGQFTGDGGLATAASLSQPEDCVDSSGNIFIADTQNNCVRKVAAGTNIITTFAGQGMNGGNLGDGGLATSATLGNPTDVVVDSGGSVYIADDQNARVQFVSSGMINNYAGSTTGMSGYSGDGGPAIAALISNHPKLAIDSSNNIYIADGQNNVIREVLFSTSHINTIVGTGVNGFSGDGGPALSAQLSGDRLAVAVGAGATPDVIVLDQGNARIRTVHSGTINTTGGSGFGAFADGRAPRRPSSCLLDCLPIRRAMFWFAISSIIASGASTS